MRPNPLTAGAGILASWTVLASTPAGALAPPARPECALPAEEKGVITGLAACFARQSAAGKRSWHVLTAENGRAYVEALPDTRRTHDDPLVRGESFSDTAGEVAVLEYPVRFERAGRYYVWVRARSTGTEDNGIHVGLDGAWPESGRKMQWCEGKGGWTWASAQRTEANHCGEPGRIWLDVPAPGLHTLAFSMREDGFEFDRWLLTRDPVQKADGTIRSTPNAPLGTEAP